MKKEEAIEKAQNAIALNRIQDSINVLLKYLDNKDLTLVKDLRDLKAKIITLDETQLSTTNPSYIQQIDSIKRRLNIIINDLPDFHTEGTLKSQGKKDVDDPAVHNVWGFVLKLLRFLYDHPGKTLIALLILLVVYVGLRYSGRDLLCLVFKDCASSTSPPTYTHLTWAEKQALSRKPYAILSLVQHITLSDLVENGRRIRKAQYRNSYTIRALKKIDKRQDVFTEQYYSGGPNTISPWAGSENQNVISTIENQYYVSFDADSAEVKTIVTGVTYKYLFPLSPVIRQVKCFNNYPLGEDEWMACYPNAGTDSDYIDKLTILIEAENFNIFSGRNTTFRKSSGKVEEGDGICRTFENDRCTLLATWMNVSPTECVSIKIRWPKNYAGN